MTEPAKKSIAIVTPVFPPYRGGIGTVAELDARQLAALGFDVHVYVPAPAEGDAAGRRAARAMLPYAVHELRPWLRYGKAALVPQVAGLLQRYDTVLLQHPFFGGTEMLMLGRAFSRRGTLLIEYHMDVVGHGVVALFSAPTRWCLPWLLRRAAKTLLTSFDYNRSGVLAPQLAAAPQRFAELPIATDVNRFSPAESRHRSALTALRGRYGIAAGERVIVHVGGLDSAHYFKGVPVLLDALAALGARGVAAKAVLVGDGDLRPGFEARAAELGIADHVTFAGSVSDAELPDHYRLADVFAFPSIDKSEAFGIAALEASACGVPVVATNLPGVRTVVRDGETGLLVPPNDAAALATALGTLLNDAPRREAMGRAGRLLAEREYSQPARLARWKALLTELRIL